MKSKFEDFDFLRNHQYSMTETGFKAVSHRLASPDQLVRMPMGTTADGSIVWNFEFNYWKLF